MSRRYNRKQQVVKLASLVVQKQLQGLVKPKPKYVPQFLWNFLLHLILNA